MRRAVICLASLLLFVTAASGQAKSVTGTVVDYTVGNSGKWAGIDVKVGSKKYFVYTESSELPTPTIVGNVTEVGRTVQVFYITIAKGETGYDGELRATRIVEIKPGIQAPTASNDGFSAFYATFKAAVSKNDRAAIRSMMAPRFEWALDGYISRDDALRNMDEMKVWRGLRNAVTRPPVRCKSPSCRNRSGYHVWSSAKYAVEIMFERINGQWQWSALLGD
jgi:hypothetical protein